MLLYLSSPLLGWVDVRKSSSQCDVTNNIASRLHILGQYLLIDTFGYNVTEGIQFPSQPQFVWISQRMTKLADFLKTMGALCTGYAKSMDHVEELTSFFHFQQGYFVGLVVAPNDVIWDHPHKFQCTSNKHLGPRLIRLILIYLLKFLPGTRIFKGECESGELLYQYSWIN